jgi:hypothetical protein
VIELLRIVGVSDGFAIAAAACIFESQMLWAAVAHVGNDALSVPLTLAFIVLLARQAEACKRNNALMLSFVFSAGLLSKAYFFSFLPVFLASVALSWRRLGVRTTAASLLLPVLIDGPWYARNALLYGSITGTQQSIAGIGFVRAISAVPHIHWITTTVQFLRWSLWTGNWSFISFSQVTINLELVLVSSGLVFYLLRYRAITNAQRWMHAATVLFALGLVYQTCVTWIHTNGESTSPEPWYWQGVTPCLWAFSFSGLQNGGSAGRVGAAVLLLVSSWVALMTQAAKLLPFYAGGYMRSTLETVVHWWSAHPMADLGLVAGGPVALLIAVLVSHIVLVVLVAAIAAGRIFHRGAVLGPGLKPQSHL